MIRLFVLSLIVLASSLAAASPRHWEPDKEDDFQSELNLRYLYKNGLWTYLGEIKTQHSFHDRHFSHVKLGTYYRAHNNLKLGLFYIRQYGARHDEDWISLGGTNWDWENSQSRSEDEIELALVPRWLLSSNIVAEIKTRWVNNSFNSNQTLKVRPGVTYYLTHKGGKDFWNLYLQYERYIPLNFGDGVAYEEWLYLGGLYHLTPHFKPGIFIARRETTWVEADDFTARSGRPGYSVTARNSVAGLNLIWVY